MSHVKLAGKQNKGFRRSVYQDHSQNLPSTQGWVKKRNPQGIWQRRWFTLNNHYLVYFKDDGCKDLRGSIDLLELVDARVISRFGDIEIVTTADEIYPLKCVEPKQAAVWVQAIKARVEYYSRISVSSPGREVDQIEPIVDTQGPKSGWLLKRSPAKHTKFQERFVCLEPGAVMYYKREADPQPQGIIAVDGLNFVRPFDSDPACVTFELRRGDRTFVFKAQTNAEMRSWISEIERHWQETLQQTEAAKRQAMLSTIPYRLRHFDEIGAEVFKAELRDEMLQLFSGTTVAETLQGLNQSLELLEDVAADCEPSCGRPARLDVMAACLSCVDGCVDLNLSPLLSNTSLNAMSLEELYQLIDWVGAHHAQIQRFARHVAQADLPPFAIYDDIPRLCELYLHGPKGSAKILHQHVHTVVHKIISNTQEMVVQGEDGKFMTHAPVDVWEMLHQHISLATNTQSETLHVLIINEIGQALTSVATQLGAHLSTILTPTKQKQQEHQEGLLELLCAIANDMVVYTEEIANVVADFEADAIKDKLDQVMDDAVHKLLECGQLAINMLAGLVILDTESMLQAVFSPVWLKESSIEVVAATAHDYLNDFAQFLSAYWANKIANSVLLEVVCGYAGAIIARARSFGMGIKGSLRASDQVLQQVQTDIEILRQSFETHTSSTVVDGYLCVLHDIHQILSVPASDLVHTATSISTRGNPLGRLVTRAVQTLFQLRDDTLGRSKAEREVVLEDIAAQIEQLHIIHDDSTRSTIIYSRVFPEVTSNKLRSRWARTISGADETTTRMSRGRESNDSDSTKGQLLTEILELARRTDGHVIGATGEPLADRELEPLDNYNGSQVILSGMMWKLSKRHIWITRWFELAKVRDATNQTLMILGWSKKQDQGDYTAQSSVADIVSISLVQSPRPIVYTPHDRKAWLNQAAPADKPRVAVASHADEADGTAQTVSADAVMMFDFRIVLADRADMLLRVKTVDDLIGWINALAEGANLAYDTSERKWIKTIAKAQSPSFNPKARMKNLVRMTSSDSTDSKSKLSLSTSGTADAPVLSPLHAQVRERENSLRSSSSEQLSDGRGAETTPDRKSPTVLVPSDSPSANKRKLVEAPPPHSIEISLEPCDNDSVEQAQPTWWCCARWK